MVLHLEQRLRNLQKQRPNLIQQLDKLDLHKNLKENIFACVEVAKNKSLFGVRYRRA